MKIIPVQRSIYIVTGLMIVLSGLFPIKTLGVFEKTRIPASKPKHCTDMVTCRLPIEIQATEGFLRAHKVGLTTPDPRPLTPIAEVIRLNVVPQALGYLNLYRSTHNPRYLQEAKDRLTYLQQVGPTVYGGGVRSGMVGYAFLLGYELSGDSTYKTDGLRIADDCVLQNDHDAVMNGGLMCGFHLTLAYRLTQQPEYQTAARDIIERTAIYQRSNGGFPHQPDQTSTSMTSYTAWMATELLLMRQDDPYNDLNDLLLSRVLPFLEQRVNANGTINYKDANGSYYEDPGNGDGRYGTSEVIYIAYDLYAGGRVQAANRALRFFFSTGLTGVHRGSYPDKYKNINPENIWETAGPSVVRTSINFWYMTLFSTLQGSSCSQGATRSCVVSSTNCSTLYQSLGQCDQGISGTQTCLQGSYSPCLDLQTTSWQVGQICSTDNFCENDPVQGACFYENCARAGNQICVNGFCGGICYALQGGQDQCDHYCLEGQKCPTTTSVAISNNTLLRNSTGLCSDQVI